MSALTLEEEQSVADEGGRPIYLPQQNFPPQRQWGPRILADECETTDHQRIDPAWSSLNDLLQGPCLTGHR